jgi:hypothetical protein
MHKIPTLAIPFGGFRSQASELTDPSSDKALKFVIFLWQQGFQHPYLVIGHDGTIIDPFIISLLPGESASKTFVRSMLKRDDFDLAGVEFSTSRACIVKIWHTCWRQSGNL